MTVDTQEFEDTATMGKDIPLPSRQEKQFIEAAKDATVVSLGIGNVITNDKPRVEIPGGMVIEYEDRERAAAVWKLAVEQKIEDKGDF